MFESLKTFLGGREPAGITAQVLASKGGDVQMLARSSKSAPSATPDTGDWDVGEPVPVQMSTTPPASPASQDTGPASAAPGTASTSPATEATANALSPEEESAFQRMRLENILPTLRDIPGAHINSLRVAHSAMQDAENSDAYRSRDWAMTVFQKSVLRKWHDAVNRRKGELERGPSKVEHESIAKHRINERQRVMHGYERRARKEARLKDFLATPLNYALHLPAEGDFSSPPKQRLLGDPTIQTKLYVARALNVEAEIHKLQSFDLCNPQQRKEELEHKLTHCASNEEMRAVKAELVSLSATNSKVGSLAAQARVRGKFEPVHFYVRELVTEAERLLGEWESEARAMEALFFASAGVPAETTAVSRRFAVVRREIQTLSTLPALYSFFGIVDPLDKPID